MVFDWSLMITSRECPRCCLQAGLGWDAQADGLVPGANPLHKQLHIPQGQIRCPGDRAWRGQAPHCGASGIVWL